MTEGEDGVKPRTATLRRLVDRLAAIKLRAYVLRRPEPLDPAIVDEQLAGIERDVEEATQLVRDERGSAKPCRSF